MRKVNQRIIQKDAKQKIFEAAAELFARDGYYKTSVREICEAAGVTKPVLYYYFKDKETLLEALVNETYSKVDELMAKHIGENICLTDVLKGLTNLYLDFIKHYPHLTKFSTFIQSSSVPKRILEIKINRYQNEMQKFEKLIIQSQKKGIVEVKLNAEILAKNFIGTIIIMLSEYLIIKKNLRSLRDKLNLFTEFWIQTFIVKDCQEKL